MRSEDLWLQWGKWFAAERKRRNVSQAEVAKYTGLGRSYISVLENGGGGTKRDTVIALAEAIGADVDEALNRAGFATPPKNKSLGNGIVGNRHSEGKAENKRPLTEDELDQLQVLIDRFRANLPTSNH